MGWSKLPWSVTYITNKTAASGRDGGRPSAVLKTNKRKMHIAGAPYSYASLGATGNTGLSPVSPATLFARRSALPGPFPRNSAAPSVLSESLANWYGVTNRLWALECAVENSCIRVVKKLPRGETATAMTTARIGSAKRVSCVRRCMPTSVIPAAARMMPVP